MKLFVFFLLLLLANLSYISTDNPTDGQSQGRILGGYEARPNSHPYVVSIQTRMLRYRICSGSIISEYWIVSSGHCVVDPLATCCEMDAVVGAHNLNYISSSQIYRIKRRILHPYYRGGVGPNDISMLKTERKIKFSETVAPIKLPFLDLPRYRGQRLVIAGWGEVKHTFYVRKVPNKLQEAHVTYLPFEDCYRAVNHIKDYYQRNPLYRKANICTGPISQGVAGCLGDSGGPLIQYVSPSEIPTTTMETTTMEMTRKKTSTTENPMSTSTMSSTCSDSTMCSSTFKTTTEAMATESMTTHHKTSTTKKPMCTFTMSSTGSGSTMCSSTSKMTTEAIATEPMTTHKTATTEKPMCTSTMSSTGSGSTMCSSTSKMTTEAMATEPMTTHKTSTTEKPMSTATMSSTGSGSTMCSSTSKMTTEAMTTEAMTTEAMTTESMTTEAMTTEPITTDSITTESTTANSTMELTTSQPEHSSTVKCPYARHNPKMYGEFRMHSNKMERDIPVLVGIISWGVVPCGGAPTVYTDVNTYMDFIEKYMLS